MLLIIHYSDYQCRSCWQQNVHKKYCFNDGRTLCTQKSCTKHSGENVTEVNLFFPPKYRSRRIWNYFYLLLYIIHVFFLSLKTYFQTISKSKDLKCSITVLKKQSHNTTDMTRLLHLNAGRSRSKRGGLSFELSNRHRQNEVYIWVWYCGSFCGCGLKKIVL